MSPDAVGLALPGPVLARVPLAESPVEGRFLRRPNRFLVTVEVGGASVEAHLPNPGRLEELLRPGRPVILNPRPRGHRRTPYDLVALQLPHGPLVSLDTRIPNRLVRVALESQGLPELGRRRRFSPEVRLGASRIDFRLDDGRSTYVEVKSCTLVEEGTAWFPDAPTLRGRRHVEELREAVWRGSRAAILFVIQRADARELRPREATDPRFGQALRRAAGAGVEVLARRCHVTSRAVSLGDPVPVRL